MIPKDNIPSIFGTNSSAKNWRTDSSHLRTRVRRGNPHGPPRFSPHPFFFPSLFSAPPHDCVLGLAAGAGANRRPACKAAIGRAMEPWMQCNARTVVVVARRGAGDGEIGGRGGGGGDGDGELRAVPRRPPVVAARPLVQESPQGLLRRRRRRGVVVVVVRRFVQAQVGCAAEGEAMLLGRQPAIAAGRWEERRAGVRVPVVGRRRRRRGMEGVEVELERSSATAAAAVARRRAPAARWRARTAGRRRRRRRAPFPQAFLKGSCRPSRWNRGGGRGAGRGARRGGGVPGAAAA